METIIIASLSLAGVGLKILHSWIKGRINKNKHINPEALAERLNAVDKVNELLEKSLDNLAKDVRNDKEKIYQENLIKAIKEES